jgi:hypothetical protein
VEAGLTTGEEAEPPPPQARLTARLLPLWRDRLRRSEPTAPRIPTTPKQPAREVLGPPGQENLRRGAGAVDCARAAAAGRIAEDALL